MPDTPKTLYKYVTADRALTCIPEVGNGTLRATQPAALNDPFECALVVAGSRVLEERDKIATLLTAINARKPVTEKDVDEAQERHGGLFLRQLFADRISTKFGLISLAADPFHPLMWSHYTVDGSGFVIGYDVSELDNLVGEGGCLRAVQYEDFPPLIQTPDVMASEMSNPSPNVVQEKPPLVLRGRMAADHRVKCDYWYRADGSALSTGKFGPHTQ